MTKSKKLVLSAQLLMKIIAEESDNKICRLQDSDLAEAMTCSVVYVTKLIKLLKEAGKIETKKVGRTGREIKIIK